MNLYCEKWKLHTCSEEKPPVKFRKNAKASCSLISNGVIINGTVENFIISPGVYIDKEVEIKENCKIGYGDDYSSKGDAEKIVWSFSLILWYN